jgi:hypothetical protein
MYQLEQLTIKYYLDYLGGIISDNTKVNTTIGYLVTNDITLNTDNNEHIYYKILGDINSLKHFDISNGSDIILKEQLDFRIVSSLQLQIQAEIRNDNNDIISSYGTITITVNLQITYEDTKKLLLNNESKEVDICIIEDPCIMKLKMTHNSFYETLQLYSTIEYVDNCINEALLEIHSTIGEKLLTLTGEM